ncbi:MAG: FtsX-like permease family protein [Nitriliruptorales bacterium]|nr:FtsX-like permease family protein [Nitriliruptorales bacterium]
MALGPRWRYTFAELGKGLRANLLMTVATVLTVMVSLTLGGMGLLAQRQVDSTSQLFYSEVEVSIYLQADVPEEQRLSLEEELQSNPEVGSVDYVSSQEAYEVFQELFADDPALLESVDGETLPESFRLKLVHPENFSVVRSQYVSWPGVEDVTDQSEVLDRFFGLVHAFKIGGYSIAGLQLVGGAALIANTIRLSAFARREQIGIMKLVGATNWYIRMPFILEGVVTGLIGSIGALLLLLLGQLTLVDAISGYIQFIPLVGVRDVIAVAPLVIAIGVAAAALASFFSLRRFLDV